MRDIVPKCDPPVRGPGPDLSPILPLIPQASDGWPILPGSAFYGLPGEVVRTIEAQSEADPAALLVTFLATFGAAVGRVPHAVADGAEHPARLFAVLVGETSKARKGTSWTHIRQIFLGADQWFTDERVIGGFGSGEAVVDAAADPADRRMLVVEPEWARILSVGRRDGSTLSPLLRQAWDGDRLAVRSRSQGSVVADDAHIAVLGHVTVEEVRAKLTDTEMANGFANRHLFCLVRRSKLLPSGGHLGDREVRQLAQRTRAALMGAREVGVLRRTRSAETLWAKMYQKMADDDPGGLLGSVIARDAAQVLRLSVTYALSAASATIDDCHVEAAWALWTYCRQSAAHIFGDACGNPLADRVLRALRDAGAEGLDGRDLDRAVGRGHVSASEMQAARELLTRRGLIRTFNEETGGRPRTITVALSSEEKADQADKGTSI